MKIVAIVLGATGLVGSHLVTQLIQDKRITKIITITRRPSSYKSNKVDNIVVNFERLNDFKHAFEGDILFSCLGTTFKQAGSMSAQRHVDVDYQFQAAQLASSNGVEAYVLISSSGANSKSVSPYLKMKGELEHAVKLLLFEHLIILQPSLLIGERETFRAAEGFASRLLPIICKLPGLRRYHPIHAVQVAQKMIEVGLSDHKRRQTFRLDDVFPIN